ncbi:hypothetical protein [Dysgonomonas capnocytophagoides]|uniref:hypothetical protein n=1 Tax=Dysgonomonas capnocytophagoides TaxID=45254 RepID=UPI0029254627|nr:hypothetical protein DCPSUM001_14360 [Dysgonomonas capnocytophagoides]
MVKKNIIYKILRLFTLLLIGVICIFKPLQLLAQVGINTLSPNGIFHIDTKNNNQGGGNRYIDDVAVDSNGRVGLGTNSPAAKIHIEGSFILDDGNQIKGKALLYNGAGQFVYWGDVENTCYWIKPIDLVGMTPPPNLPQYMGKSITLPKGSWLIKYATTWSFQNIGGHGFINMYLSTVNVGSYIGASDIISGSWVISEVLANSSFSSSQNMLVHTVTSTSQTLYVWTYYNTTTLNNLVSYEPAVGTNVLEAIRWE